MWLIAAVIATLAPRPVPLAPVSAAQLPSLFRGVVVADSPIGVRVVSVEPSSQAYEADLRPEDVIVRIDDEQVDSIDGFATLSMALKGRTETTTVLVFRNGKPREILLHLYSYAVLRRWDVRFVPDDERRFAQPKVGVDYWTRLGRAYGEVGRMEESLDAYLNALHNDPTDVPTAILACEQLWKVGQRQVSQGKLREGVSAFGQAVAMLQQLFQQPLTDEQLRRLRDQLQATVAILHDLNVREPAQ
jgi:hypothetical protein